MPRENSSVPIAPSASRGPAARRERSGEERRGEEGMTQHLTRADRAAASVRGARPFAIVRRVTPRVLPLALALAVLVPPARAAVAVSPTLPVSAIRPGQHAL